VIILVNNHYHKVKEIHLDNIYGLINILTLKINDNNYNLIS
jgi:hypothetical protein